MQVNYTLNYQTCDNEIPGYVSGLAKVLGALTSGKRERVTRIQTVLYLIVPTVSLSSGETVQTKWQPCQDANHDNNRGNRRKSGENNPKQIESPAADERKHKQDCWKQFVETDSDIASLQRAKLRNAIK